MWDTGIQRLAEGQSVEVCLLASRSWPLVGRTDALGLAVEALTGGAGAVVVAGRAGAGRTRFGREVLAAAAGPAAVVEWITAAHGPTAPMSAFAHLAGGSVHDGVRDPGACARVVAAALRRRAAHGPLAVGVDDAHLLDPASAAFLRQLHAAGIARVVATVRADAPCPHAVRALWKDGDGIRVDLSELDEDSVGELLVGALDAPVEDTTLRRMTAVTGGNLLLLRELVHDGLESGHLREIAGQWRWTGGIGPSGRLRDVVEGHLTDLPPGERRAVELLAIGGPLGCPLVHSLVGDAVVGELSRRSLVQLATEGRRRTVTLAYPLHGMVLIATLPAVVQDDRRTALLHAVAARGARRRGDVGRCARWRLDRDGAAPAWLLTAAAAQATTDPALRLRLAQAAARRDDDERTAAQSAVLLARAYREHNRAAAAAAVLGAVDDDRPDDAARAELVAERAAVLHQAGRRADAEVLLGRAAQRGLDHPLLDSTRLALQWDRGDLRAAAAGGLRIEATSARRDPQTVFVTGMALVHTGRTAAARALADRAQTDDPAVRAVDAPRAVTGWALLHEGRLDEAGRVVAWLHGRARRDEDPASLGLATTLQGVLAVLRGDVVSARRWLIEATGHLETSDPRGLRPMCLATLAQSAALGGDVEGAQAWCVGAGAAQRSRRGSADGSLAVAEIRLAVATGQLRRGREVGLAAAARCGEDVVSEARVLHEGLRVGFSPPAVADRLRRLADTIGGRLLPAYADHADALARADGTALDHVSADFADMGMRLHAAESSAEASSSHRSAGQVGAALRSAARSAVLAESCPGLDRGQLPSTVAVPLSRREREVVALAARGSSNQQIAAALTVSVRTVESHLYHAYAKLGVARRSELGTVVG